MIPELHGCDEAEDFFRALGVPFDAAALAAHRLPILRRFGELLVQIVDAHPGADDRTLRALARAALQEAYHAARLGVTLSRGAPPASCGGCALVSACGG